MIVKKILNCLVGQNIGAPKITKRTSHCLGLNSSSMDQNVRKVSSLLHCLKFNWTKQLESTKNSIVIYKRIWKLLHIGMKSCRSQSGGVDWPNFWTMFCLVKFYSFLFEHQFLPLSLNWLGTSQRMLIRTIWKLV